MARVTQIEVFVQTGVVGNGTRPRVLDNNELRRCGPAQWLHFFKSKQRRR